MQFNLGLSTSTGRSIGVLCVFGICALACAPTTESPSDDRDEASAGEGGEGGEGGQAGSDGAFGGEAGASTGEGGSAGETNGGEGGAGGDVAPMGGSGGVNMPVAGAGGSAGAGGAPVAVGGNQGTTSCKTNVVCDDFETYAPGAFKAAQWSPNIRGATMVVDESRARSGKRSIKITVPQGGDSESGHALLSSSDRTVLSTGKSAYARMMVYLDAIPSGQGLHWAFMRANGFHMQDGKSAILSHSIGGQPGRLRNLMLWPTSAGLQDCFNDSNTQIPTKSWTCVEWHLNPESQTMEVWFNGQKQAGNSWTTKPSGGRCSSDQTGGKWVIPKISVMHFGWVHFHAINGATMWIDDIALDTKRIGCPQ